MLGHVGDGLHHAAGEPEGQHRRHAEHRQADRRQRGQNQQKQSQPIGHIHGGAQHPVAVQTQRKIAGLTVQRFALAGGHPLPGGKGRLHLGASGVVFQRGNLRHLAVKQHRAAGVDEGVAHLGIPGQPVDAGPGLQRPGHRAAALGQHGVGEFVLQQHRRPQRGADHAEQRYKNQTAPEPPHHALGSALVGFGHGSVLRVAAQLVAHLADGADALPRRAQLLAQRAHVHVDGAGFQ